jgi:sigma-B regulation protein RsbU (phosphoserine phosphatase)
VGGDFYDFYFLDDKRLLLTIADVSDKGVPAALFMVRSKTVLGSSILRTEKEGGSLADAVMIANDELCQNNEAEQFVTAFAAVIDMVTGQVSYVNAGHNPPVLLHKQEGSGAARLLPRADNPMLGVMEGLVYKENTLQLAPGDTMLLYTDGVTEAMNKEGQMFTKEQLLRTLSAGQGKKAEEIVSICMEAVGKHAAGAEASDDITMLCFHWQGI